MKAIIAQGRLDYRGDAGSGFWCDLLYHKEIGRVCVRPHDRAKKSTVLRSFMNAMCSLISSIRVVKADLGLW